MRIRLLDTYALVGFFRKEKSADIVGKMIRSAESGEEKTIISSISVSELYYIISRYQSQKAANDVLDSIKTSRIETVPVDEEIARKGGEFKFAYSKGRPKGMPIADAVIAATAFIRGAVLVSSSEHFDKISEIKVEHV